jgi:hypothetical protein
MLHDCKSKIRPNGFKIESRFWLPGVCSVCPDESSFSLEESELSIAPDDKLWVGFCNKPWLVKTPVAVLDLSHWETDVFSKESRSSRPSSPMNLLSPFVGILKFFLGRRRATDGSVLNEADHQQPRRRTSCCYARSKGCK